MIARLELDERESFTQRKNRMEREGSETLTVIRFQLLPRCFQSVSARTRMEEDNISQWSAKRARKER